MPSISEVFAEAAARGELAALPETVFPRLHKPTKDVSLQMDFLRATAAGADPERAKAAIRLVAMLAYTRLHDSVARPIAQDATLAADAGVRLVGVAAVVEVDAAKAAKVAP